MDAVLLDKRKSLMLKGGGILLMLAHHLFYNDWSRELYNDIYFHGVGLVNQIGIFSKLCVAIFVFVSGYGLAVSTPVDVSLKGFYWHRFKKLYLNYWFIWVLFVPIGVFVFGRSFSDAYGDNVVAKSILDFFGLLKMFGCDSYNPTWWFYNCIIILYLISPFLNKWVWKYPLLVICLSLTLNLFYILPGINVIASYLIVFLTGILMSKLPLSWINGTKIWHIIVVLVMLSAWRFTKSASIPVAESFICIGISIFVYKVRVWKWLSVLFEELGNHSMNMFLIHTFIFYMWFSKFVYITRNPLLIFLTLLISSYLLSVVIEFIKRNIGFYKI